MKNTLLILFSIITIGVNAQGNVGINTEEPTRTLDINGELRIRQVETGNFEGSFLIPTQGKDKNETHLVKRTEIQFKHVFTGVTTKTFEPVNPVEGSDPKRPVLQPPTVSEHIGFLNNTYVKTTSNGRTSANYIDTNHITFPYISNYIGIKTPGMYLVEIVGQVNIKNAGSDEFTGSFGKIDFILYQQGTTWGITQAQLLKSSNIIFQGAALTKGKGAGGATYYDFATQGLFMFKGGTPLYLDFFTYGVHGMASSLENITLPAGKTFIKIYKIL